MEKDYQLRKNYYFCILFLSKSRTLWQTNFNRKSLLEQMLCLVEISIRNHLVLYGPNVAVSCRDKLLMQNLISANHSLLFFSDITATESNFYI